ncbi:MarR family transcriptional regulator [Insulibacter thermoxylanivorax]|uniref:MarR family transcriptional regulator n=1 Tax=Insulibacter thermoxylanivorax TaxID=2749268 RepID=A0A916QAC9_9BACL|nr:MarR family transcriptional regulator [Insulibacter thermoxylanivorax]GFR37106.1 MarR family transcriptional regulator [Insulibacter thermoxylanivorax]
MSAQTAEDVQLSLKLFVVLSKASKVIMEGAVRDMKKYGVSPTEFTLMELLYHKGDFPLQQIGNKILMTSGSITYNIDKLENKGLIRRIPSEEDRRVIYARLTEEGRKLIERIFPLHSQAIHQLLSGLTDEEKETLIPLLKKLGIAAQQQLG